MIKVRVLPVVDRGWDTHGLPTRLSVPAQLTEPVRIMADGKRIGEVAPDGSVKWLGRIRVS